MPALDLHDPLADRAKHRALDGVLELPDVARPLRRLERPHGVARQGAQTVPLAAARLGAERGGHLGDVLAPFGQRRHADGDDIEPIEQILPELPVRHRTLQIHVRPRDDTDVGLHWHRAPQRIVLLRLEQVEERRLRTQRHVADLVEEERSVLGLGDEADPVPGDVRRRTTLRSEQLALHQRFRQRRAVHHDERTARTGAVVVNEASEQGLPRSRVAGERHVPGRGRRDRHFAQDGRHRLAASHQPLDPQRLPQRSRGVGGVLEALLEQEAIDERGQVPRDQLDTATVVLGERLTGSGAGQVEDAAGTIRADRCAQHRLDAAQAHAVACGEAGIENGRGSDHGPSAGNRLGDDAAGDRHAHISDALVAESASGPPARAVRAVAVLLQLEIGFPCVGDLDEEGERFLEERGQVGFLAELEEAQIEVALSSRFGGVSAVRVHRVHGPNLDHPSVATQSIVTCDPLDDPELGRIPDECLDHLGRPTIRLATSDGGAGQPREEGAMKKKRAKASRVKRARTAGAKRTAKGRKRKASRAKARTNARKPARRTSARKKPTRKKPARKKAARKRTVKKPSRARSTRAKQRKPAVDRTRRVVRPAAAARPLAAAAPARDLAPAGGWERLAPRVAAQLETRGWSNPDPDVVSTIAAIAAGHRMGPAADPPFPTAFDADSLVADAFVDFYWTGSRSPGPDRRSRLPEVRAMVDSRIAQLGPPQASATARETIAWIALGVWRPGLEEITRLHALPAFIVPWYRAGLA